SRPAAGWWARRSASSSTCRQSPRRTDASTTGKNVPVADPFPENLKPMAATLLPKGLPSPDEAYAYEFKWDGVRAVTYVRKGKVLVESRNLLDVPGHYPELAEVGEKLAGRTAVIDGEIVALDKKGRPSFQLLQGR